MTGGRSSPMQAGSCIKQRGRGQTLESHAYLSPGSARYSLGHLRETTRSFVGIEPVPGGCDVSGPLAYTSKALECVHSLSSFWGCNSALELHCQGRRGSKGQAR